jgi:glycerate 2-kinase
MYSNLGKFMKIIIAADSFKDALDTFSVCKAIQRGIAAALPDADIIELPLSDGGEGLSDIAAHYFDLQRIEVETCDPLFRKHTATYGLSHDNNTAFIEMAQAAGLQLLKQEERNPLKTTTYGVGLMIKNALERGAKRIIIGLGGSATNDAGIGMAAALGWQFLDKNGENVSPIGENLIKIEKAIPPQYNDVGFGMSDVGQANIAKPTAEIVAFNLEIHFEAICDVKNPLFGTNGAAYIFAKQKGATEVDIETLDKGLQHFAEIIGMDSTLQGAGAAGGLGFGCLYALNATMKRGIDSVLDWASFDEHAADTDYIFTGEGRLDAQTLQGKLIAGITERAKGTPTIALCGALDLPPQYLNDLGLKAAFSINQKPCTLPEALVGTAKNLEYTAFNIARLLHPTIN